MQPSVQDNQTDDGESLANTHVIREESASEVFKQTSGRHPKRSKELMFLHWQHQAFNADPAAYDIAFTINLEEFKSIFLAWVG